jgi:predicted DNA-binding transcriptional regulator AlpA
MPRIPSEQQTTKGPKLKSQKARLDAIRSTARAKAINNEIAHSARPPPRLWAVETVLAYFGGEKPINISTLYRGIGTGRYPKPINVGGARWIADECEAALDRIIAKRDSNKGGGLGRPRRRHSPEDAAA